MSPPNLKILAYEDTDLGPLCLRRRELLSEPGTVVTEVTLNHEFLMSSYNTDSERAISNRSAEIHGGSNLKALVGGFGLVQAPGSVPRLRARAGASRRAST